MGVQTPLVIKLVFSSGGRKKFWHPHVFHQNHTAVALGRVGDGGVSTSGRVDDGVSTSCRSDRQRTQCAARVVIGPGRRDGDIVRTKTIEINSANIITNTIN